MQILIYLETFCILGLVVEIKEVYPGLIELLDYRNKKYLLRYPKNWQKFQHV